MKYKYNLHHPNVSFTTQCPYEEGIYEKVDTNIRPLYEDDDEPTHDTWTIDNINKSVFVVEELINTLHTIDKFKKKYPNDEYVFAFDEIVRQEICEIFGGELPFED